MTRRADEFPTKDVGKMGPDDRATYSHDAFATATMTIIQGGNDSLFGSDLKHNQRVRIEIQRATIERSLSNDWIHGSMSSLRSLVTFEMSHAQFAQFITSQGNGSGTPVTLRYAPPPGTPTIEMPGIKNIESKAEVYRREIKDSARKQLEAMQVEIDKFGAMLATGKVNLKEAREIHKHMGWKMGNLPGNMEFVVEQAEVALEKAQSASMIEIEAYMGHALRRVGLDNIQQLAGLGAVKTIEGDKNGRT